MTKALIIGIDSQDGSYLSELLLEKGSGVVGCVPASVQASLQHVRHIQDKLLLDEADLLDQGSLAALLEKHRPDEVYNFAAPSFPAASWDEVQMVGDVAALGAARLLEAVRQTCPKARFFQASSSELFGNPAEVPQNENTPFRPRNPYGISKLYAHWMTVNYRDHYGLYAVSGILFNHESPRRGVGYVTRKISNGVARIKLGLMEKLHLGNLEARRDWGYAGDYVQAIWMMLHQDQPENYVVGTGETHSVREFCRMAFGCVGLNYADYVVIDERYSRPHETGQLVADPRRVRERLGWEPKVSFEELVQMMVAADLKLVETEQSLREDEGQ